MIPFQKIFTLIIRTFSKPMLGYLKKKQQDKKMMYFNSIFIFIGKRYHFMEHWINHRIIKSTHKKTVTELKDQVLLEKGIEGFYQLLFYCIVLGLPFYQLYKASISAQKKEEALQKRIHKLDQKLNDIGSKIGKISKHNEDETKARKEKLHSMKTKRQLLQTQPQSNLQTESTQKTENHQGEESVSEKIQDILQNALDVVADEFEDVLDDVESFEAGSGNISESIQIESGDLGEAVIADSGSDISSEVGAD